MMSNPFPLFVPVSHRSGKVRCIVCGATGFDGCPWQWSHERGHEPCPWCGKQLSVRLDGTARVHSKCPERPPYWERQAHGSVQ
jgi:ribosomal protein S27E